MSTPFDPYYKWLGIAPDEQPPNHYRLLGIRLFEEDSDVIENAADGRMALLRSFQTGAHVKWSQKLLNEIAAARITLLDRAKRAAYDEELRRREPPEPMTGALAGVAPQSNVLPDSSTPASFQPITIDQRLTPIQTKRRAQPRPVWRRPAALSVATTVLLLGAALVAWTLRGDRGPLPQRPDSNAGSSLADNPGTLPIDRSPNNAAKGGAHPSATGEGLVAATATTERTSNRPSDGDGAVPSADVKRLAVPTAKKVLLIFRFDNELAIAKKACEHLGLPFEVAQQFDKDRTDYSGCHTILSGTNNMDYWQKGEAAQPEAFNHLEQFVAGGGHLIILGSFNARGTQHLKRFGIETSFYHNEHFEPAGRATELFALGNEHRLPQDGRVRSFGNFNVTVPHVVLLKNGKGNRAGSPKLATLEHEAGRLTYTLIEPNQTSALWLIEMLLAWVSRGSPIPTEAAPHGE